MRTELILRLAVALGLLAGAGPFAAPAFADAQEHATQGGKSAGEGAKKEGEKHPEKDQTAFMGIKSYDLAIYTLVVFFLLLFVLGRFAWGPIMQGLQKREDAITQARADAELARGEAQKLLDEVRAQRAAAGQEVAAILTEARRDAAELRETEKAKATADIQKEKESLKREIAMARDTAMKEIYEKAVELAAILSTKAVRRELTADDHRRLIDEALTQLQQNVGRA